jgi:hypothetical protein
MSSPTDIPGAAEAAFTSTAAEVSGIILAGAVVAFGVYALKPAWRAGKAVLNKIGF